MMKAHELTIQEEIAALEAKRASEKYPQGPIKRKPKLPVPNFDPLGDDDVAGGFFADSEDEGEAKKEEQEQEEKPAADAAPAAADSKGKGKGKAAPAAKGAAAMPARKSGFKGVADSKSAALLEADF